MLLNINPHNPEKRKIAQVVAALKKGAIIIYPTDTIYGLGCDIHNKQAMEKICLLKGIKPEKANLSFICNDLNHLSEYAKQFSKSTFRLLNRALPGPYTFILNAHSTVPKMFKNKKKTVGIRVPDSPIANMIVAELGRPLLSTSIKDELDEILEYITDPYEISKRYEKRVDIIIDGGPGGNIPSTVIDCTDEPEVIREGIGYDEIVAWI